MCEPYYVTFMSIKKFEPHKIWRRRRKEKQFVKNAVVSCVNILEKKVRFNYGLLYRLFLHINHPKTKSHLNTFKVMEEKNRILCMPDKCCLKQNRKKRINFRWYILTRWAKQFKRSRPIIDVIYVIFITIWEGHLYKEIPSF